MGPATNDIRHNGDDCSVAYLKRNCLRIKNLYSGGCGGIKIKQFQFDCHFFFNFCFIG